MDRNTLCVLHLARVGLEAKTPLSVTTGSPDNVFDTALVRDANGLPAIPGTAIAGVLRHLWWDLHGKDGVDALFGHQERDKCEPSRLTLTWGALLDSQGRPAEGLLIGAEAMRLCDPLFNIVRDQIDAPVFRNRVRLTHKGAASDRGKFDRAVLPAGHRFALELRLWSETVEDPDWIALLDLFAHPGLRLGGATRAGLGRVCCKLIHRAAFDMRDPARRDGFLALGRALTDTQGLVAYTPKAPASPKPDEHGWYTGKLHLKARGLWRIGQGDEPLDEGNKEHGKPPDLLPVVEENVVWDNGRGRRTPAIALLPAASLKGALAHRMAFHARRFADHWNVGVPTDDERPAAVEALLGEVKDKKRAKQEERGRAGALFIDDAYLQVTAVQVARLMHNAIDRFTGGVRDRVLYEEDSLFGGEIAIELALDTRRIAEGHVDVARRALKAALDDLCQGRLALGSRTTTGNGFFDGRLEGPLAQWLDEQKANEEAA